MDVPETCTTLTALAAEAAEAFPRPALRGRVEQVQAMLAHASNLLAELPGEEEREAEYETRLTAGHDAGFLPPVLSSHAQERLGNYRPKVSA